MIGRLLIIAVLCSVGQVIILALAGANLSFWTHVALGAIIGTVAVSGYIIGFREQIDVRSRDF
jgi:hypothetical protein